MRAKQLNGKQRAMLRLAEEHSWSASLYLRQASMAATNKRPIERLRQLAYAFNSLQVADRLLEDLGG